ncbi:MAG TPA: ABC transporter ATP-binding protein/permease [Pseudomonadales bacterium]|jgi:ABC-type transport system involved in Fe-S cluster assembly fused permease/ATPase subunit|nr:ABC transporter ATP-binding protein/permease [Pseudomonadales bacterium]HMW14526.1 ABC transporter ATP-binding protein/permease [Pseudomonadales bacterium]HMW82317.1 ABC transporter ATP-binding protein/permease [Pseudomonadales bacterium]HMY96012.1 ABC transporter ATP-binding protein/permease [Pseudomonadales bacterium]HMZ70641.1 ABC transporter ATP-binding protein/permease [Pseudomonadales bacterium]
MRGMRPPIDEAPELESQSSRSDWATLRTLFPYLWRYRQRVILALLCLVLAKVATVSIPLLLKQIVDGMTAKPGIAVMVPLGLILAYGAVRLASTAFVQVRNAIFAKVEQGAIRQVALEMFNHLHQLSLRFHLDRQTGGVSRDIARGTRGIGSLLSFLLFSIIPTLLEIALTTAIFMTLYDWRFVSTTLVTVVIYVVFTIVVTNWRTQIRRTMNELDSRANVASIDSLLNYETVKYFGNETFEAQRYDAAMQRWEQAAIKNEKSMGVLNSGQSAIIAVGVTLLVWLAADGVAQGSMTLGDLVAVNAFLIQLYTPLNALGMAYREIRQALTDMEKMFALLREEAEVGDAAEARPLATTAARVDFDAVDFGYDPRRPILRKVTFSIPAGQRLAVVGSSGAGKSTLVRLLFRFYDVSGGAVRIDGVDIRQLTQQSLRAHIGIVPQDTVLFNDTIYYNIAYGRPTASREEVIAAARSAQIHHFIEQLPDGWQTLVGERGLKLSGGEKQRVAIARTILKNPPILIFDEATSALDSPTERSIQSALAEIARNRTTLIIAHRLSTVVDADEILVLEQGEVVERGSHAQLLAQGGVYARMWLLQQHETAAELRHGGALAETG